MARVGALPTDAEAPLDAPPLLPGLDSLLFKTEPALSLGKPPPRRLAGRPRRCVLRLAAERVGGVLDSVFEPVALDASDATIPSLGLVRVGGPAPQLLDDVGGRCDPGGGERLRGTGVEKLTGDLALAAGRRARRLHPGKPLGLLRQLLLKHRLARACIAQLLAALAPAERFSGFAIGARFLGLAAKAGERLALALVGLLVEGPISPKSKAGVRTVPILGVLRDQLDARALVTGSDLVFGRGVDEPFGPKGIADRAKRVWTVANERERGAAERDGREPELLRPITLHECRHTFASLLIDAGVNPKAIQEFMGHATIEETFSRYGHLMPGARDQARKLVDAYMDAAT